MIIQKFKQAEYGQFKTDKKINHAISFAGKKELLQDIVEIAKVSPKTSILEDSSPLKKIELTIGDKTYVLFSREIERFKNIFSSDKHPSIIHELKISKNNKKVKTSRLKANEFAVAFDKLREIVLPQILKKADANFNTPEDLLKNIGNGLLEGQIQTGESLVAQGTNHYLQIGKTFQLPNKNTVSLKHYFKNDIVEDLDSFPEIDLTLNNFENHTFVISKQQDRELFANTLKLNELITNRHSNLKKLEELKFESQKINQTLDNFQNNFEAITSQTNKQIEDFKGTFTI